MTQPVDRRPVSDAFIDLLERGSGVSVYWKGDVPATAVRPFVIVDVGIAEPNWAPTLESDYDAATLCYEVTSVGERVDQAEALADRVRRTIVQRKSDGTFEVTMLALAGLAIKNRTSEVYMGVLPAGDAPHVLYNAHERFALYLSPA